MNCLKPIQAWQDPQGNIQFKLPTLAHLTNRLGEGWRPLALPCGKCFSCQKNRAFEITVRAVAESRMHDYVSFITLTVDDNFLPVVFPHGLCHRPWQLFAKRLRKHIGKFTFLMCGEYGTHTMRPHYHAIIFGHQFTDSCFSDDGFCTSRVIKSCWPFGHIMCDKANNNRIAYVAGYTMKDFPLGRDRKFWESNNLGLPYVKWSRNPSLGLRWLQRYSSDLVKDGSLEFVLNGKLCHISGRYFLKRLQFTCPEVYDKIMEVRLSYLPVLDDGTRIMRHSDALRSAACNEYRAKQKKVISEL